jgi:hypothetical protein
MISGTSQENCTKIKIFELSISGPENHDNKPVFIAACGT